jgi:hypothetical protein
MKEVAAAIFDKVLDALKRPLTPEETGGAEASKKARRTRRY